MIKLLRLSHRQYRVLERLVALPGEHHGYSLARSIRPAGMSCPQTNRCCHQLRKRGLVRSGSVAGGNVNLWGLTEVGRAVMAGKVTPLQYEHARHALGLPSTTGVTYRNRFITGVGGPDHESWMALVSFGAARRFSGNVLTGGDDLFCLTLAGARMVLRRGERLDKEDFPDA